MTNRELLNDYRNQVLLLLALDQDLTRLGTIGAPMRVKAQRYDDVSRGTNDPTAASMQAWDGLLQRRDTLALALSDGRKEAVLRIINTAKDSRTLMVLMLYYLHGLTDQQIADQIFISREQVNKRRNDFIHRLT